MAMLVFSHRVFLRLTRPIFCSSVSFFSENAAAFSGNASSDNRDESAAANKKKLNLKRLYLSQGHWKSNVDLVQELRNNVVYFDPENDPHGLVAINKPYGLPLKKSNESEYSFQGVLPLLQEAMGVSGLFVVKVPERFSSGIALLATKESTVERIKKSNRRSVASNILDEKYLTITDAFPRMNKVQERVYILMKRIDVREPVFGKHHKEPVITRIIKSKRFLKKKLEESCTCQVYSEVLSRSAGGGKAALVDVQPSMTSHHFIPNYMSDLLSPVLGDKFFSYRARPTMGVMMKVGHEMSPHEMQQILPDWMLSKLDLERGDEHVIPKHVHLTRVFLPGYLGKDKDLTVFAPPPKYFMETAERLMIKVSVQDIFDQDKVRDWKVKEEKTDKSAVEKTHLT